MKNKNQKIETVDFSGVKNTAIRRTLKNIVSVAEKAAQTMDNVKTAVLEFCQTAMQDADLTKGEIGKIRKDLTTALKAIPGATDPETGNWSKGYWVGVSAHVSWAVTIIKETFSCNVKIPESVTEMRKIYNQILKNRKAGKEDLEEGNDDDSGDSDGKGEDSPRALALKALNKDIAQFTAKADVATIQKLHAKVTVAILALSKAEGKPSARASRMQHAQA